MNIPEGLKYTKEHEWVKVEGNIGTVGVTDYAQGELGDIIYIDVTTVGSDVAMGDTFGTIEAVKTVSDMYAPISGKITEFNAAVNENPASVNQDPYGNGWLVKIDISNMGDLDSLLSPEEYKNLIGG
ncbi:MAG: glycine cleavage system protein GcvH [Ignavibacteria bacterium]|nr:glycine cleavage system protein GcvH [Ignavibacteria bacterium]